MFIEDSADEKMTEYPELTNSDLVDREDISTGSKSVGYLIPPNAEIYDDIYHWLILMEYYNIEREGVPDMIKKGMRHIIHTIDHSMEQNCRIQLELHHDFNSFYNIEESVVAELDAELSEATSEELTKFQMETMIELVHNLTELYNQRRVTQTPAKRALAW